MIRAFPVLLIALCASAQTLDFGAVASLAIGTNEVQTVAINGETVWRKLPYDEEIDWIESTGTQWIDTGVAPDSATTRVAARIYVPASDAVYAVFGSRTAVNVNAYNLFGYTNYGAKPNTFRFDFGYDTNSAKVQNYTESNIAAGWWNLDLNGRALYMTNGSVSQTLNAQKTSAANPYPVYLFSVNTSGTAWNASSVGIRCSFVRIWQGGVLVRDFVPVRIGAEGALYDRVSGTLFTNAGTGSFGIP